MKAMRGRIALPKHLRAKLRKRFSPFLRQLWECVRVFAPLSLAWLEPATNSIQCPIETRFQRSLPVNLNSPESDARTRHTPKALRAKSMETTFSFRVSFGSACSLPAVRGRLRSALGLLMFYDDSKIVGHFDPIGLERIH